MCLLQVATAFHTSAAADDEGDRPAHDARDIWDLCTTIIAPKTFRLWGALESFMIKYNHTLTQRAEVCIALLPSFALNRPFVADGARQAGWERYG